MVYRFSLWYTGFVYGILVLFMVYRFSLWYTGFDLFLEKMKGLKYPVILFGIIFSKFVKYLEKYLTIVNYL